MVEDRDAAPLRESGPTAAQRGGRAELGGRREIDKLDKVIAKLGTMPRILCWKCRKLTPFELDRCQHCGSAFAGSTGGAYGSGRTAATLRTIPVPKPAPEPPKRTLSQIFEDLQRVHDVASSSRNDRPREKEVSLHLYQCPSCGRFVSEQATECACGVGFASNAAVTLACPECGSHVPADEEGCPVCGVRFAMDHGADSVVYTCPRCGAHVASDALRCGCGVWFED